MDIAQTKEAQAEVDEIARRHDLPVDAVSALSAAIRRGGGRQAQFSHPALGGMGQWSRGGGIMIGDMFNRSLKAKVEQLCNALAEHLDEDRLAVGEASGTDGWWPREMGHPSSVGSQNEEAYAFFPDERRLAIRDACGVRLYDTGDHRITGVSQQQGSSRDLTFSSQRGTVRLSDLTPAGDSAPADRSPERSTDADPEPATVAQAAGRCGDNLALLERLHELRRKDILSEEEFAAKKKELLARL